MEDTQQNQRRLNDAGGESAYQIEPGLDPQSTNSKISDEIEEYLNGLNTKKVEFEDPKLKRERQKLLDLLSSYKRLSVKLDKKCEEAERQGLTVPTRDILARRAEIRALLHPELYRNKREEEKNRLVEKFSSKRLFNESDKVCPPDLTPVHVVSDERQLEKERFCRLLASAPARFHNVLDTPTARFKRLTRPPSTPIRYVDVRESEKERLARIFATSAAFVKDPNLRKSLLKKLKLPPESKSPGPTNNRALEERLQGIDPEMCQDALVNDENNTGWNNSNPDNMVRLGEYSPLNSRLNPSRGLTVLGVGENDERKKILAQERQKQFYEHLEKERRKVDKEVMVSPTDGRRSVSSASTQTDDSLPDISTPIQPNKPTQPNVKAAPAYRFIDISPREKLLSDLYGYRPGGDVVQEEKSKRIAYAQALKEQIEEKKRLEDEKKRREREEEELEERRYKEQAERIQKEFDYEQHQKLDMVIQRQAQEELLRQRLAEKDEEVKEMKMRERLNRLRNGKDTNSNATRGVSMANVAAAHSNRQHLQTNGRALEEAIASVPSVNVLPEQPVEPEWDQDWTKYMHLEGVDLLREHRSQKERLQLPPVVDTASKLEQKTRWSRDKSPIENGGYLPSNSGDAVRRTQAYREQAEAILKAPLDEEIISINPQEQFRSTHQIPLQSDTKRSAVSLPPPNRPKSPVLPALRTESRLRRNSKILDEKWQVPPEGTRDLGRTLVDRDNILTQLGAFRRQLAKEHQRLEQRIRTQPSSDSSTP